jgi:hypothetical protein
VWPAGRRVLGAIVALVQEARTDGDIAIRYIRCDACGGPTPHHAEVQIFSATANDPTFIASPPEVVCGLCASLHPRVIDDEPPRDTVVTCSVRRPTRWPLSRLPPTRRLPERWLPRGLTGACGQRFSVPAGAALVLCPRCVTHQPGPAAPGASPAVQPRRGTYPTG